ncbi:MAG: RdgB/HAM1 family non-canonical purine NTP pyrophosphatase [Butyrivibrio sp.]|nr:RdgB/HAM1 family non-canonical purine NTP pyrophosphatase [Butyrivibrio sp.]
MRIVFATGNKDKMREIRQILGSLGMEVVSMKEADADVDVEENGTTFAENSMIKARAVAKCLSDKGDHDSIVLADDSGLEIDYLNGEPGIYSARYLGKDTPYPEKNSVIISRLDGVKDEERSARFVCAISAVLPDGKELSTLGKMEGRIGYEIAGENGFGYDPIFFLPEYGKTSAELTEDEKNAISHRGKALRSMEAVLKKELGI